MKPSLNIAQESIPLLLFEDDSETLLGNSQSLVI